MNLVSIYSDHNSYLLRYIYLTRFLGHPEWLDFPRHGNNNSFHYCRRQFNLVDDELLRYRYLYHFDSASHNLEDKYKWLAESEYVSRKNQGDKVIVFERGGLLWIFNFHPTQSFADYRVGTNMPGPYKCVLNTDNAKFMGHSRINEGVEYPTVKEDWDGRMYWLQVYVPCRVAIVLAPTSRILV